MSGECDDCGDHILDCNCKCLEIKFAYLREQYEFLHQRIDWIMDWVPLSDKKFCPKPGECPFFSKSEIFQPNKEEPIR